MNLNRRQETRLHQVARRARTLAEAKQAAREATEETKAAVFAALDAGVPMTRVADAAGVQRSLIYHWLDQDEAAAA